MTYSKQQTQFFFYQNDQNEASELLYLCNHQWTHPTAFESSALFSDWHPNTVKSSYWNFRHEWMPSFTVGHFLISRGVYLCDGAAFLRNSAQWTLIYRTVNKTINKQTARSKLKSKMAIIYSSRSLYIYIKNFHVTIAWLILTAFQGIWEYFTPWS